MPDVKVTIGGRDFEVSCQTGEEHFLKSAAALLDAEASVLSSQIGRLPENRMLLMAGLMLSDKTAGLDEQLRSLEQKLTAQDKLIEELRARPAAAENEAVEVEVIPPEVIEKMALLAARAEAMAVEIEDRLQASA